MYKCFAEMQAADMSRVEVSESNARQGRVLDTVVATAEKLQ